MKIVPASPDTALLRKKPLLTLTVDLKETELSKCNTKTFDLKINPADANSATYKSSARVLRGDETVRQVLQWCRGGREILTGLNLLTLEVSV